ncbi:MAG TPA: hypothetical protein DGG94_13195 [Micromonosporaceae bacterium]|nr:hypothetical protein [Micromonosporaceae bacterium]HCU50733.1 hypothetical protein [Micromonosporaceae bacterium]
MVRVEARTTRPSRAASVLVIGAGLGLAITLISGLDAGNIQVALLALMALLSGVQGLGTD